MQINKVNKFSKLLTFINGGGNAAHKILRIFAIEKADYDIKWLKNPNPEFSQTKNTEKNKNKKYYVISNN